MEADRRAAGLPGRLCPNYSACYYYKARRQAERAQIIITNHSVVLQDALMAQASEDEAGLLGSYDFLILDELTTSCRPPPTALSSS